ncbi:hypothetical protein LZ32DRAFT_430279 [Colletotrichum eremochloae]|nr:hypothetical protein LZ32DRAFT_430279 [Colletotrichum eremochloae]
MILSSCTVCRLALYLNWSAQATRTSRLFSGPRPSQGLIRGKPILGTEIIVTKPTPLIDTSGLLCFANTSSSRRSVAKLDRTKSGLHPRFLHPRFLHSAVQGLVYLTHCTLLCWCLIRRQRQTLHLFQPSSALGSPTWTDALQGKRTFVPLRCLRF